MHVLVTGASSGIGEAVAVEYHRRGAAVTLVARRKQAMETLAAKLGSRVNVVAADLLDLDGLSSVWAAIERHGPVDVLVNNAGMQVVAPYEDGDIASYERSLALNLTVPMRLIHYALPGMLQRGRGGIVNIASLAAIAPTPFMASYNASKAGLAGMSEALRGELRGTGVSVLTVYPGPVKTAMADAALDVYGAKGTSFLPTGTTSVLAARVASAERKHAARLVYPRVYHSARLFPGITRWIMDRFTPSLRN